VPPFDAAQSRQARPIFLAAASEIGLPSNTLLAPLPRLDLDATEGWRLGRGQAMARRDLPDGDYRTYAADRFVGVAHVNAGVVRPRRLLATGNAGDASLAPVESLES